MTTRTPGVGEDGVIFFLTIINGKDHALLLGRIMPLFSMSLISLLINFKVCGLHL